VNLTPLGLTATHSQRPLSRRALLAAAAWTPGLGACATEFRAHERESLQTLASRWGICAVGTATLRGGTLNGSQRLTGCSHERPVDNDDIFQAASLTKPLAAYLALRLAQEGRLDLQAPVSQYLPDGYEHVQNPFAPRTTWRRERFSAASLSRIPVGSLLNHSSGLPNWSSGALSIQFDPGTRWRYSGEAYVLLQRVLVQLTGQEADTLFQDSVLQILGMSHSSLTVPQGVGQRLLRGTRASGVAVNFEMTEPNAAASLYTTAADYAKFMASWLVDESLIKLMLSKPVPVNPALGLAWGYGWGIEQANGGPYLWQWGNNPGFRAFAMMSASSGDGFVLLTNHERGMPLAASLARSVIPAEHGVFRSGLLG
jgi:CubicO group peptidase (beta-lactamase class C family)